MVRDFFKQRRKMIEQQLFTIFKNDPNTKKHTTNKVIQKWVNDYIEQHDEWQQMFLIYQYYLTQQEGYDALGFLPEAIQKEIDETTQEQKDKELKETLQKQEKRKVTDFLQRTGDFKQLNFDNILNKKVFSNEDKIRLISNRLSDTLDIERMSNMYDVFQTLSPQQQQQALNQFSNNKIIQEALKEAMLNAYKSPLNNDIDTGLLLNNAEELSFVRSTYYEKVYMSLYFKMIHADILTFSYRRI